jgi:sulfoxide reductase heme-binding subunit YedZ
VRPQTTEAQDPTTRRPRSARAPLGGIPSGWRDRFLRFHLPLAVGSLAMLVLFMTLPAFDPLAYVRADMGSHSALPRPMDMGGGASSSGQPGGVGAADHGAGQTAPPADHGGSRTASATAHAGSAGASSGHASGPTPAGAHGTDPAGQMDARGMTDERAKSRLDQRLTVATGYVAIGLLALTLLVGPANLLLRRRNPVSSYLRRDAGMWTAGFSVVHVFFGLQVHSAGQLSAFLAYFVTADGSPLLNSFGLGNWTGLLAIVIVAGLLTISSDLALRILKAPTWKWLQRLNYAVFALVVVHAFFYGALLRVTSPFTVLLLLSIIAVSAGQATGIWLWRRRHPPTPALTAAEVKSS